MLDALLPEAQVPTEYRSCRTNEEHQDLHKQRTVVRASGHLKDAEKDK